MKQENQAFALYPTRPFDRTWNSETWGYPIRAERCGPFEVADPDNPRKRITIERLMLRGQPGYEIVHSVPLPPGELPEGLQPEEPFDQGDKDLFVRLELGEVVDGVLMPLDPRGLREWTRLKTHLIEICEVGKENLPILHWEEILAILRKHANPDRLIAPNPAGGPQDDCVTFDVAQRLFEVSRPTLQRAVQSGELRSYRKADKGKHRVRLADLERLFGRRKGSQP